MATDAAKNENSVLFTKPDQEEFVALRDAVQSAIKSSQQAPAAAATSAATVSVADELLKLAQLRDSGILSDSEFEAQKSRLLQS